MKHQDVLLLASNKSPEKSLRSDDTRIFSSNCTLLYHEFDAGLSPVDHNHDDDNDDDDDDKDNDMIAT